MQRYTELPDSLQEAQHSLEPYIKQRQEIIQIRQILAAHLSSQVHQKEGYPIFHPLSLVETSPSAESSLNGILGVQKEYIRCLEANIKARKEFVKASKEHQLNPISHNHQHGGGTRDNLEPSCESDAALSAFIDNVKYCRKHERLLIMQHYVDAVAQKSPETANHLSSGVMLKASGSLPKLPPEVMSNAENLQLSEKTDLKDLVNRLEKAVLRAKLLLQREQKFLSKVKTRKNARLNPSPGPEQKLQALGTTRNELINWIGMELAKTSDDSPDSKGSVTIKAPGTEDEGFIDNELVSIQRQYNQYSKLRRALILAATGLLDKPAPTIIKDEKAEIEASDASHNSDLINHATYSYLVEMMSMANEQKFLIQQKSYITISLAKHLKEAGQGVDRLSEESHLLLAHPMPGTTSHGSGFDGLAAFGGSMSSHEKPDSSRKARAWVFAVDSARMAIKNSVTEKVEDGKVKVLDARQTMQELHRLLGEDGDAELQTEVQMANIRQRNTRDIWASLVGNLTSIN